MVLSYKEGKKKAKGSYLFGRGEENRRIMALEIHIAQGAKRLAPCVRGNPKRKEKGKLEKSTRSQVQGGNRTR